MLVVEDEAVVSLDIEDILKAMGCEILGPTGRLDAALELATNGDPDAAILDVMIRGGRVFPVAERLMERDIPFVLASGYGRLGLASEVSEPAAPDEALYQCGAGRADQTPLRGSLAAEEKASDAIILT
ncbi:MAG: hypothetical protein AB7E66_14230, partial [Parvibaculaceae bacterium]